MNRVYFRNYKVIDATSSHIYYYYYKILYIRLIISCSFIHPDE